MSYQILHNESHSGTPFLGGNEKETIPQTAYHPGRYGADSIPMKSSYEPLRNSHKSQHQDHSIALRRVQKLQRVNGIFGTVLSLGSSVLAAVMASIIAYVLYKFYTTKDIAAPQVNRTSPWATGTQLWPAFLLAVSSVLTLLVELGGTIAACCKSRSKGAGKAVSTFENIGRVIFVAQWLAVAILYRVGKTTKDLWGWSCDQRADEIQQFYPQLDFQALCTTQVSDSLSVLMISADPL